MMGAVLNVIYPSPLLVFRTPPATGVDDTAALALTLKNMTDGVWEVIKVP